MALLRIRNRYNTFSLPGSTIASAKDTVALYEAKLDKAASDHKAAILAQSNAHHSAVRQLLATHDATAQKSRDGFQARLTMVEAKNAQLLADNGELLRELGAYRTANTAAPGVKEKSYRNLLSGVLAAETPGVQTSPPDIVTPSYPGTL